MEKVLIFGVNSFTGRYLKKNLLMKGYEVYGSSRSKSSDIRELCCDITIPKDIDRVFNHVKPDYIFILSGISRSEYDNNLELYNVNVIGPLNILESLSRCNHIPKKVLFTSSASVYGNYRGLIKEDFEKNPVNHYGNSKLVAENLISNYFGEFNIIIMRPFNYFGLGQSSYFVIPKILNHIKFADRLNPMPIHLGNLEVSREFNDVSDVVECFYRLMKIESSGIKVNVSSSRSFSISNVLEIALSIVPLKLEIISDTGLSRKYDIINLQGDDTLLNKLIGENNFKTSLESSISNYILH